MDAVQPESHSQEFFVELKNKKRNGVESAVDEPWLYVYGESQLGEIFSKKYVTIPDGCRVYCVATALVSAFFLIVVAVDIPTLWVSISSMHRLRRFSSMQCPNCPDL